MRLNLTIKSKLFLFFFLLLFVVGGIFGYVALDSIRLEWAESEMVEKLYLAKTESSNISRWIESELKVAYRVADSAGFASGSFREAASELRKASELAYGGASEPRVMAVSGGGTVLYESNATDWDEASLTEVQSAVERFRKGDSRVIVSKGFYVYSRGTTFLLIIPAKTRKGRFAGTLNILLDYEDARIKGTPYGSGKTADWQIVCADSIRSYQGRLGNLGTLWGIWMSKPKAILLSSGGYFVREDGLACAYAPIPYTDSYVMIIDPVPGLNRALTGLEKLHVGFGVIALLLIVSFSIFFSGTLVRPIAALTRGAEALRDGTFKRIDARAGGELAQLIDSFNEMGEVLQKSTTELRALSDFSSSMISDVRDENVCEKVAAAVAEAFEVQAVVVSLIEGDELVPRATVGIVDELVDGLRICSGDGLLGSVFRDGRSIVSNDLPSDSRLKYARLVKEQQFCKFAGVPLLVQGKPIGVLAVLNPENGRDFNKSDVYLLSTFAGQAAIKIRNHDLFRELEDDMGRIQQLQAGLVLSEKLVAVGQLVSGVAHELNNPLGVILGYSHLAVKKSSDKTVTEYLKRIETAAERAAGIVRNLLTFARKKDVTYEKVDLNEVLRSVCDLVYPQFLSSNITLRLNLCQTLPATAGDFQQLQEVFLNLVTNAIHSMEGKGGGKPVISTFKEDTSLVATVADDGEGIKPEILPKVFEPFITTKPVGKGTGLGLSLCCGIVKQHGGDISVQSFSGKGSIFTVELPIRSASARIEAAADRQFNGGLANSRVLVVEDEPEMRELLRESLEERRCLVKIASNGKEALRVLSKTRFSIVISDLRMPEMDGKDFYQACSSRYPEYRDRFIFISGDTASEQAHDFLKGSICEVLFKPFALDQLFEKISRIEERANLRDMRNREDKPPAGRSANDI